MYIFVLLSTINSVVITLLGYTIVVTGPGILQDTIVLLSFVISVSMTLLTILFYKKESGFFKRNFRIISF